MTWEQPNAADLAAKATGLRDFLNARIIGQPQAIDRVVPLLENAFLGLSDPDRPYASFLFVGPTGVGKTEMTKAISEYAFGIPPLSFDMSEFQLQNGVEIMLGKDPAKDMGRVGDAVMKQPFGVCNFDEMEKAHVLIWDLFLQLLDEGRLTAANSQVLNFRRFVVTMTSNIGAREAMRMRHAPFIQVERIIRQQLDLKLRPEFQERFSDVVPFRQLDSNASRLICDLMCAKVLRRLRAQGHEIELDAVAGEFLLRKGIDRERGARRLRRIIELYVENAVAPEAKQGRKATGKLTVDATGRALVVR